MISYPSKSPLPANPTNLSGDILGDLRRGLPGEVLTVHIIGERIIQTNSHSTKPSILQGLFLPFDHFLIEGCISEVKTGDVV